MNTNIVILTGNHLCHNPRVLREGNALAQAGYKVTVLGAWFDKGLKAQDLEIQQSLPFEFKPAVDGTEGAGRWMMLRVCSKLGLMVHRFGRFENRSQLGHTYHALYQAALREPADLYIAHSESAMSVAVDLKRKGHNVGVDMEDWFSEDLPPEARKSRPVRLLRALERELLTAGAHATCPSHAMSDALQKDFGCPAPAAVYNTLAWSDRETNDRLSEDRRDRRIPSIHWFSQTLGHGRGLEDLIAALPLLKQDAEIHLRGKPASGFENSLTQSVPEAWRRKIFVHGLVPNAELLSRISEHDIGFAGETPVIRSRDLTVTNKILYYLMGGLAVVASDTAGQQEVAEQAPGSIFLYPSGDPSALARRLDVLLGSADLLERAKRDALHAAERTFCWERQERVLLESIGRSMNNQRCHQSKLSRE